MTIPRTKQDKRKLTTEQRYKIHTIEINNEIYFMLCLSINYGAGNSQPDVH